MALNNSQFSCICWCFDSENAQLNTGERYMDQIQHADEP